MQCCWLWTLKRISKSRILLLLFDWSTFLVFVFMNSVLFLRIILTSSSIDILELFFCLFWSVSIVLLKISFLLFYRHSQPDLLLLFTRLRCVLDDLPSPVLTTFLNCFYLSFDTSPSCFLWSSFSPFYRLSLTWSSVHFDSFQSCCLWSNPTHVLFYQHS